MIHFLYVHHEADRRDHAPDGGRVLLDDALLMTLDAQRAERPTVLFLPPDGALRLGDPELLGLSHGARLRAPRR